MAAGKPPGAGLAQPEFAYVQSTNDQGGGEHWREKQATLNLRLGCPDDTPCWDAVAREAAEEWNDVGSRFRFSFLSPSRPDRLSCTAADDRNTVLWAARDCQMAIGDSALAITFNWTWASGAIADSDVVFNTLFVWDVYDGHSGMTPPSFGGQSSISGAWPSMSSVMCSAWTIPTTTASA